MIYRIWLENRQDYMRQKLGGAVLQFPKGTAEAWVRYYASCGVKAQLIACDRSTFLGL